MNRHKIVDTSLVIGFGFILIGIGWLILVLY